MAQHQCVYAELGFPERCVLKRVDAGPAVDQKQEALDRFFQRRGRRCPACRKKVEAKTSAGGRLKRYHATCV